MRQAHRADFLWTAALFIIVLLLVSAAFGPPPINLQPGEWRNGVPRWTVNRYRCTSGILARYDTGPGDRVSLHCLPIPGKVQAPRA